ncbi:hypothetical protein Hanom_Chr08g00682161 [Helianthus anomalus]
MLLNKLLFHTLIVNRDEQMVSGIGSESVLNFPNQIDFRSVPVPNRTVLGIFSTTHPYL